MTDERWHRPAGSLAVDGWAVSLDPPGAGWGFAGLRVAELEAGAPITFGTGDDEGLVLPLAGAVTVACDGEVVELAGRKDVFAGVTDFAYLPLGSQVTLTSDAGARVAVPTARARRRLAFRHLPASGVVVELRGAGPCSRQVNNFATPDVLDADRLIACEVLTPAGNWSSFPPHKHDEDRGSEESELEEVYYFEVGDGPGGRGLGYQRVYGTAEHPIDVLAEVRSGDVVLVPHGWHGPSMAVPGYDLYYLNVMAGPGEERAWRICDDPAHAWVRDSWAGQACDPRLPMYAAPEVAS
jgi:5-deoxy-glucuronate isomerase